MISRFIVLAALLSAGMAYASPGWDKGGKPALLKVQGTIGNKGKPRFSIAVRRTPDTKNGLHVVLHKRFGEEAELRLELLPGIKDGTVSRVMADSKIYDPHTEQPPGDVPVFDDDPFAPVRSSLRATHRVDILYREFFNIDQDIGALEAPAAALRRHVGAFQGQVGELSLKVDGTHISIWRFARGERTYFRHGADGIRGLLMPEPREIAQPPHLYLVEFTPERAPKPR